MIRRAATLCLVTLFSVLSQAQPAPPGTVSVQVSSEPCPRGPADPPGDRLRVYIENLSQQRVSANVRIETQPAGQRFDLLDNQLGAFDEQFPRFYEHRLAPREKRGIGCSAVLRTGRGLNDYKLVPVEFTAVGVVIVDPNVPVPPDEDARLFVYFMTMRLPDNASCLSASPGLYFATSLHPSRNINAQVEVVDRRGRVAGVLSVDLNPQSNQRLTCTQADDVNFTVRRVLSARFTSL